MGFAVAAASASGPGDGSKSGGPDLKTIRAAGVRLKPLQNAMPPVQAGDWLAEHRERGQSFDKYIASSPNRPDSNRTTLYVQPLGEFVGRDKVLLDRTIEFMAIFYNTPVKALESIDLNVLPESARRINPNWGMKQVDSLAILELLKQKRPKDAVGVLGLTATDLWPNEKGRAWNFVFGQASLGERVGVWSIARLRDKTSGDTLALQRTLKVAVHETGHMLGIQHCTHFLCGMNGSNSLSESDRQPMPFCSECEMKVWWACGPDIGDRYKKLAAFARANSLEAEARFWKASAGK